MPSACVTGIIPLLHLLLTSLCCTCHWHRPLVAPVADIIPLLHLSLTSSPCCTCHWHHPLVAYITDAICLCHWHHHHAASVTDIIPLLHLSPTSSLCCVCHWHHPLGVHIDHWSWRQRRMESLWCWKGAHKAKSIFQWILWYGCSFDSVGLLFIIGQILSTLIVDMCYGVICSWAIHWNRCSSYEIHTYTLWIILLLILHNMYVYNHELTITIKDLAYLLLCDVAVRSL